MSRATLAIATVFAMVAVIVYQRRRRRRRRLGSKDTLLLERLLEALSAIDEQRWRNASAAKVGNRVSSEDRALSWAFIQEWQEGLKSATAAIHHGDSDHGGSEATPSLNSYMIVGDKDLNDEWQGNFGRDSTCCLPWCIRALTRSTTLSLVETLILAYELTNDRRFISDQNGRPYFGRATHFVSYFWAAPFSNLIGALAAEGAGELEVKGGDPAFFWIDIFSVAQCKHSVDAVRHNQDDVSAFEKVLGAATSTWMWCEPWHDPASLKRVWCLFEALKTLDFGKTLKLTMSGDEKAKMRTTLVTYFERIMSVIAAIDARNADATNEADKDFIFGLIDVRRGGLQQFNADLVEALRGWLLGSVLEHLAMLRGTNANTRINSSSDLDETRNGATRLLTVLGRYREALPLHLEATDFAREKFGSAHEEYARRLVSLGKCNHDLNRFDAAEELFNTGVAILKDKFGENHPEVASVFNNMTLLYHHRSRLPEATALARTVLQTVSRYTDHDPTPGGLADKVRCDALNNLGNALRNAGHLAEARQVYEQSLAARERKYGASHPEVALALNNLANLMILEGDFEKALPVHERALDMRVFIIGPRHPQCATSLKNIALCLQKQGRRDEAEKRFQQALALRLETFGELHSKTAEVFALLGDIRYFDSAGSRPAEALYYYKKARDAWGSSHGTNSGNPSLERAAKYVGLLESGKAIPDDQPLAQFT